MQHSAVLLFDFPQKRPASVGLVDVPELTYRVVHSIECEQGWSNVFRSYLWLMYKQHNSDSIRHTLTWSFTPRSIMPQNPT